MIRYCADDIGLNPEQIRRVADCAKNSALNVASVFGNSPFVAESIAALRENCALALHFNLSEGKGLSAPAEIPLLAKADGSFYQNFLGLLLLSLARPKGLEEQVRVECAAQLGRFLTYMPEEYRIRIDSHRHVHLIPAVFRGVCRALQESGRETEHLRWPVERVSVYLRLPRVWPYIRPENMLKVILLRLCSLRNEKLLRQQGLQTSVFCGIVFAGCMTDKAVIPALGRLKDMAEREGRGLELLFHPGGTERGECYFDQPHSRYEKFYLSPFRKREAETLKTLKSGLNSSLNL